MQVKKIMNENSVLLNVALEPLYIHKVGGSLVPSSVSVDVCRPRSVATTLCLTISFYYLSIIKYRLYGYIIQLVLSGDIVAIMYQYRHHRQSFATI